MHTEHAQWCNNSQAFFEKEDTSRHRLHKEIAQLVHRQKPERILDYGAGDGRLILQIPGWQNNEVMIYDPDQTAVSLAKNNFNGHGNVSYTEEEEALAADRYDTVICCNVVMCLSNEQELAMVIASIKRLKTDDGMLYLGMTHPCFLDREFATYSNEYVDGARTFNYFRSGDEYRVFMRQDRDAIVIKDFFWSLSDVINRLLRFGFQLLGIKELKDIDKNNFSPFIILILK